MSSKQVGPESPESNETLCTHDHYIPCPLCKGAAWMKLGDIHTAMNDKLSHMRGVADLLIDVPMIDAEQGSVAQAGYALRGMIDEAREIYRVMSFAVNESHTVIATP